MPKLPPYPLRLARAWLVLLLLSAAPLASAEIADEEFRAALQGLDTRSFNAKERVARELAGMDHPRIEPVLRALAEGRLYTRDSDDKVVIAEDIDGGYRLIDPLSGGVLEEVGRRDVGRIVVNNQMRSFLREAIAALSLNSPDPAVRLRAVREMMSGLEAEDAEVLRARLDREEDPNVHQALRTALALADLSAADPAARIAAAEALSGQLEPTVRNRLRAVIDTTDDPALRAAAQASLGAIETEITFYRWFETVFFGLSLGSVLVLAAIGLAITFGVMGVINMAHGELIMIGAYTTYVMQLLMPNHIGLSVLLAVPAAFLVSGLVGVAIERGVIRFLYGRPLETLLATFGISLILQQLVRSIFSPLNRSVSTPEWMSGSLVINPALSITYNRLYIVVFALLVFAALLLVLKRTTLGLKVRAVTQNRTMAKALGVRAGWVDAMTFGLGSGIAGVAGVALSQLTNVGPNLGQAYIVDSFLVVVFGGVGNLWGTLVAGLSLGVVNKFLEPYAGAVLAKILVLVFIILFIQKRPRGLFPQKGRAAEA